MRTKATPWNKSYDLARQLIRQRRGLGRSEAQKAAKVEAQKHFRLHEEPVGRRELPEDWKAMGNSRKRAMEEFEDRKLRDELKEVWD